ncbi:MAG TPA: ChbG/HpnK family deacetylase, partial [Chitinophagaceae bacterium]
ALANGIDITHLDAHMYAARNTRELLTVYIKIGREFKLPVLLAREEKVLDSVKLESTDVVVDHLHQALPADYDNGMASYYANLFRNLKPGLSCLLIHTAFDDNEMKAMTTGHVYWGSKWRQLDFDFFNSNDCKSLLQAENIRLVTWREIRDKLIRKE